MLAAATPAMARTSFSVPTIHFLSASPANYTVAHRPSSSIRLIVIHVTESSAPAAITWFRNPKAQASANYVVGQDGSITQMVPDGDIAWHAGNWAVNSESIGVENAGYTYRNGTFTDAEYRASAHLVASEMRHYILPIDRKHIIGHYQVPDPNHAGLFGGFAHHTDPGPYWNWPLYMRYVESYATGKAPALAVVSAPVARQSKPTITATVGTNDKVEVASAGLKDGATVSGFVDWRANVANADVQRVEFIVDGRVRATDTTPPFRFAADGWDTTQETNGAHVLTLSVVTKKGQTVGQSLRVIVANTPFTVAAANLTNGATVSKTVRWEAVPAGGSADHVDFLVDGKLADTATSAPYLYGGDGNWDTTKVANGAHTLTLRAVAVDGRVAESNVTVVVQNGPTQPKPKPSSGISISMNGLWQGAVVSGRVSWTATVLSGTPRRVEFWVDGRWRWSESSAPYVYGGDGNTWDTAREKAGTHVVSVRAIAPDGSVADFQTYTITIQSPLTQESAPAPTTMAVVSSIADGATLHGAVPWTATVNGATPQRVDFFIDGMLRHTEHEAPYEFGTWDTTWETNGAHTLLVRATAADGSTAYAPVTVQVSNVAPTSTIGSMSLGDGSTVAGAVDWNVSTSGPRPDRVEFWVDGKLRQSDTHAPYDWSWDTTLESNGTHTLVAKAIQGPNVDQRTIAVTVANAAQRVSIATDTLSSGQTVNGTVSWAVTTAGAMPDSVQFFVDGTLRSTGSPFSWDTTKDADGTHALLVRATAGDQVDQQTLWVTVRNTESIKSSTIANGATVSGTKTWAVTTQGPAPETVELSIDGTLVSSNGTYAWDTTKAAEGTHTLVAKVTAGAQVVTQTYTVTVANAPVVKTSTIANGQTLTGTVTWAITTSGLTPDHVELYVDGNLRATTASYVWDTTQETDGSHTLTVTLYAGSLSSTKTYTVATHNAPLTASSSIADGSTLTGTTTWTVTTNGTAVQFSVDGVVVKTDTSAPFTYTLSLAPGPHTLVATASFGTDAVTLTAVVTELGVTQNLTNGQTLTGTIAWNATPSGPVSTVQFFIDGQSAGAFTSAPYGGTLDTRQLRNGTYTFSVTATGSTSATSSVTVTVQN